MMKVNTRQKEIAKKFLHVKKESMLDRTADMGRKN